jgi:hypothetical protein
MSELCDCIFLLQLVAASWDDKISFESLESSYPNEDYELIKIQNLILLNGAFSHILLMFSLSLWKLYLDLNLELAGLGSVRPLLNCILKVSHWSHMLHDGQQTATFSLAVNQSYKRLQSWFKCITSCISKQMWVFVCISICGMKLNSEICWFLIKFSKNITALKAAPPLQLTNMANVSNYGGSNTGLIQHFVILK